MIRAGHSNSPQDLLALKANKSCGLLLCPGSYMYYVLCRPRWLSRMCVRLVISDQEVAGLIPAGSGNIFSSTLIMKYFLQPFSPFRCFKKDRCQNRAKECAQGLIKRA